MLNLLLHLLQVRTGFDFHNGEDDARDNAQNPENHLEERAAPVDGNG